MGDVVGTVASIASVGLRFGSVFLPPPFNFVAIGASFGLSVLGRSQLGGRAKGGKAFAPDFKVEAQDRVQVIRSSVAAQKIVYGTAKVSGPLLFAGTTGSKSQILHLVIPVAGHEVTAIDSVYFNDTEILPTEIDANNNVVNASPFNNRAKIYKHLGGNGQLADANMVAEVGEWSDAHRLRDIAYLYCRLQYTRKAYQTGIPNISALVRGRKLWDPRDTSQDPDDAASHSFSNNWALVVLDYLRADFGLDADLAEIDLGSFITAANIADEQVAADDQSPTTMQARYACDGVIDLENKPIEIMEDLLSAGAGSLSYSQGSYHLFAGAYVTPIRTLTADDLAGEVAVRTRVERRELFNAVRGTFVDPAQFYQPTDFPPRTNATFESQDGGARIFRDIELPFTQESSRAQRIAEIHLQKSRQGITLDFPAKLSALPIAVYDTVNVTLDSGGANFGWTNKPFRVLSWSFSRSGGIDLVLQEEASQSYDWDAGTAVAHDPAPDTTLPNPFAVAPPDNVTFESGTSQLFVAGDGTVVGRIRVSWDPVADVFVEQGGQIEVQYRSAMLGTSPIDWDDGNTELAQVPGNQTSALLGPVEDGVNYDVRVRATNQLGVPSDEDDEVWARTFQHLVIGKSEPPQPPDSFTVTRLADGTRRYLWTHANPPADLQGYRIRYVLGSSSNWDSMTPLHAPGVLTTSPFESNELAAGSYSWAIKSVDTSGNESVTARFITGTIGDPRFRGVLTQRLEHELGFPGTIINAFVDGDAVLRSSTSGGWSGLGATWDDLAADWEGILPNADPLTYETPEIDLGVEVSFTPLVTVEGTGNATITMRTGGDGSPQIQGAYGTLGPVSKQRYAQFKIEVASGVSPNQPTAIETLTILLDGEVVVEDIEDLDTSGPNSTIFERVAAGHFKVAPSKGQASITGASIRAIQNVGAGFSWELISKAAALGGSPGTLAAEFKLYDSGDTLADATVDIELKGPKAT